MIRCDKCGKRFDEEMYTRICPKCGKYNRPPQKYDIDAYFSTNADGTEKKFSTAKEAEVAHENLHRMYEGQSVHKAHEGHNPGDIHGSHEVYQQNNSNSSVPTRQASRKRKKSRIGLIVFIIYLIMAYFVGKTQY